jgi:hypothetical protein
MKVLHTDRRQERLDKLALLKGEDEDEATLGHDSCCHIHPSPSLLVPPRLTKSPCCPPAEKGALR